MKMRFWQKTYIFTLILFLVSLNLGVLSLTVYTHSKNVKNAEESAKAQQYYIAMSFERDYNFLEERGETHSVSLLMNSFGAHYNNTGVYIAFESEEKVLFSNFSETYSAEKNTLSHIEYGGERYVLISSSLCDGKYDFIYAKNIESVNEELKNLMVIYGITSATVSFFLAICLYFILKKLSTPLDHLKATTEAIEGGDFSVTAKEIGNDEFAMLAKSFNSMLEKIREQIEVLELDAYRKQMLVDNMAHELRTPLTSIYGYAEVLEKTSVKEETKILAAKYIMSESKRLQRISEILLDSAYIRENTPQTEETDIPCILGDVAEKLKFKCDSHEVVINCDFKEMKIQGNATLLSMLFYNLTENAIKACESGGEVKISCGENIVLIEDNGKGMTEEQLKHITEPFYRTDKSRSRAEGGAGLGLFLCSEIAQAHNIELSFRSEIGKGTKISVKF